MEYNTTHNHLIIREYGRHIQKMIEHLLSIKDDEIRQRNAQIVIELMGVLNPHLKNVEDFRHKLWDHLFLISNFQLNVKSPYPIPTKETLKSKPAKLPYPKRHPRYAHLGKNIELIIEKALHEKDVDKKTGFAQSIAYYMKLTYDNWHKENVHDDAIRSELSAITNNQLNFTSAPLKYRSNNHHDEHRNVGRYNNQHSKQKSNKNRGGNGGNHNNSHNKYNKKRF